jgi:hypothetical protein
MTTAGGIEGPGKSIQGEFSKAISRADLLVHSAKVLGLTFPPMLLAIADGAPPRAGVIHVTPRRGATW